MAYVQARADGHAGAGAGANAHAHAHAHANVHARGRAHGHASSLAKARAIPPRQRSLEKELQRALARDVRIAEGKVLGGASGNDHT